MPDCQGSHWNSGLACAMEPVVGFEPTTDGLQNRCSTTELNWLSRKTPTLTFLRPAHFNTEVIGCKKMRWKCIQMNSHLWSKIAEFDKVSDKEAKVAPG